jgi:DNA-binding response OmpR family regulator
MTNTIVMGDSVASMQQRILVVDDDPAIVRLVKDKLEGAGYAVTTANSGRQALDAIARRGIPHLAIVDINMPIMGGFEFCQAVQQFSDLPIIMLSAVDEEDTIIQGINRYAEDYVIKPFSPRELVARVQRVLRRIGDYAYALDPVTQIDDYLGIDFAHQQAIVSGQSIALTPTETKLLYLLIRNAGRIVSADFLVRRL